ncbi:MAG: DUF2184 domain-containing protein [Caulobacter sp.]|nr:DUF2184 domain-containing protein [Caulobacter sp.]
MRQGFIDANGVFDAQAALPFVIGQGRNIETKIYKKRYPSYDYASVIPVVTEGNEWAIGTTFFTVDVAGEAKFISGSANDMPMVSQTRDQNSHDFAMIGSGWDWTIEQINQASMYGVPLTATDAMTASDSVERMLYNIAMTGSTEKSWTGFVNDPNVSRADVATAGTFWGSKTNEQILADVNGALTRVNTQTKEVEYADSLALPPEAFRIIATRRLGEGDGFATLLEYIRKNNVYTAETQQPLNIFSVRALATASQDGGGRMVAFRRDEEVIRFHLPMPKRVLAPRQKSLMGFEQGIIARTGGVEVRLPGAMAYADEITAPPT